MSPPSQAKEEGKGKDTTESRREGEGGGEYLSLIANNGTLCFPPTS